MLSASGSLSSFSALIIFEKESNKGVNAQYNDDDDDGNDMDDGCWLQKHFQGIPRGGLRRIPQKVGARSRQ